MDPLPFYLGSDDRPLRLTALLDRRPVGCPALLDARLRHLTDRRDHRGCGHDVSKDVGPKRNR